MRGRRRLARGRRWDLTYLFLFPPNGSPQPGCFSGLKVLSSLTLCCSSPLVIVGSNKHSFPSLLTLLQSGSSSTAPCPGILDYSFWFPYALHTPPENSPFLEHPQMDSFLVPTGLTGCSLWVLLPTHPSSCAPSSFVFHWCANLLCRGQYFPRESSHSTLIIKPAYPTGKSRLLPQSSLQMTSQFVPNILTIKLELTS